MQPLTIIHVDDHEPITTGLYSLLNPIVQIKDYLSFQNGSDAFATIVNRMENGLPIDILVSDLNHPGHNGYLLAKKVRRLEKTFLNYRIPIVMLTMNDISNPLIRKGLAEEHFTHFENLTADSRIIASLFENIANNIRA